MTTTPAAIRDAVITRIASLTPPAPIKPPFLAHLDEQLDLITWAGKNPAACFRRFNVVVLDEIEPLVTPGALEEQCEATFEVTLAGKADQRFADRRGIEDVLRADRRLMNAHVGTTGRSAHGFDADATIVTDVDMPGVDESVPGVVFVTFRLKATFHRTIP